MGKPPQKSTTAKSKAQAAAATPKLVIKRFTLEPAAKKPHPYDQKWEILGRESQTPNMLTGCQFYWDTDEYPDGTILLTVSYWLTQ